MQRSLALIMVVFVFALTGCQLWAETDYEREQRLAGEAGTGGDTPIDPATPAFIQNWFYRQFGDRAAFPDLVGATDQATVLAVAGWVDGFSLETTGDDHQHLTTAAPRLQAAVTVPAWPG